ncbi:MAG: beta-ketoacyl-ACP synthase 3 [Bacteroidales bacterium]|jgi:3-oxoacyl-[acyl-carrier-protein] synthase-3|nr:beta-ketoacyl-ACP synthase 3 [Bacteroidales bacterium]MDD2617695.1 beta-ketoacyl-ACP synthase 3 [Bacteroidales bacterium]MDD4639779.1 beta-ketoacyl-ACP synthase 3 [Bacteroidales bacterium]
MKITGTGSASPSLTVSNEMLATFLDTSDEWIQTRTGIKTRQIISTEQLKDLAAEASIIAIDEAGIKAPDLDYIICSNTVNEYVTPALSCILQGMLGANCPCIDLNGACSGFIYALDMADALFKRGNMEHILIVCAEEPTRMVDWTRRDTSVLFGDGAGAVILSKGEGFKSFKLSTISNTEALYQIRKLQDSPFVKKEEEDGALVMKGQDVFKLAVNCSLSDIKEVLRLAGIKADDVDHYLLHQANMRIIDTVMRYMGQTKRNFPHNVERYGNTSSASIPMLLDELNKKRKLKTGQKMVFSAFGAGFTTGACMLEWTI